MSFEIGQKVIAEGRCGIVQGFGTAPWGEYAWINYGGQFNDRVGLSKIQAI